jgi:hypothetical protein
MRHSVNAGAEAQEGESAEQTEGKEKGVVFRGLIYLDWV